MASATSWKSANEFRIEYLNAPEEQKPVVLEQLRGSVVADAENILKGGLRELTAHQQGRYNSLSVYYAITPKDTGVEVKIRQVPFQNFPYQAVVRKPFKDFTISPETVNQESLESLLWIKKGIENLFHQRSAFYPSRLDYQPQ